MPTTRARSSSGWHSFAPRRQNCSAIRTTPPTRSTIRWRKPPRRCRISSAQLVPATAAKAADEGKQIQAAIDQSGQHFQLKPWDWEMYSEKVRKAKYDLDQNQLKPYFELNKVLHDGVFYAANKLYGITFKERHDLPVYQPDVRVFDVMDKDGSQLGIMYFDYFKRDNKAGRRVDEQFCPAVEAARHQAGYLQCRQLHQAGAGPAGAAELRRRHHHVPRIRPRAARLVREQEIPVAVGRRHGTRLGGIPLPVQRALGALSRRAEALRGELQNRRADPAGAGRQDQEVADLESGLRPWRTARGLRSRSAVARAVAPMRPSRTWTSSSSRR